MASRSLPGQCIQAVEPESRTGRGGCEGQVALCLGANNQIAVGLGSTHLLWLWLPHMLALGRSLIEPEPQGFHLENGAT